MPVLGSVFYLLMYVCRFSKTLCYIVSKYAIMKRGKLCLNDLLTLENDVRLCLTDKIRKKICKRENWCLDYK